MHDAVRRRKLTTKENQFSTMPHHGRIPTHGVGGSGSKEAHRHKQHQLPRPPKAPLAPRSDMPAEASVSAGDGSVSSSWVKPGCMMELARLAKIPQPESGLMCPRCQSTETKFCYYNNYSLSQPRHFCKTCRRYWTHGGALRDLPFSSGIRRRRNRSSKKHTSSKVACASGNGRASSSSSSGATVPSGRVAVASAIMQPLEQLQLLAPLDPPGGAEHHRTGASRLWFPGHSSQDSVGYRHQVGNGIGAATTIRLEHQCYLPQRQPFSFLGGVEAGRSFAGQMQAISRVPGSAVLTTELASEMMAENPPISSIEKMGTLTSSPGDFLVGLQGENGLSHFLGSGSWARGYGCTAGNGTGGSSCTVAPGNVWADPSGFTSSSSGRSTIL